MTREKKTRVLEAWIRFFDRLKTRTWNYVRWGGALLLALLITSPEVITDNPSECRNFFKLLLALYAGIIIPLWAAVEAYADHLLDRYLQSSHLSPHVRSNKHYV